MHWAAAPKVDAGLPVCVDLNRHRDRRAIIESLAGAVHLSRSSNERLACHRKRALTQTLHIAGNHLAVVRTSQLEKRHGPAMVRSLLRTQVSQIVRYRSRREATTTKSILELGPEPATVPQ